jgi:hypothetical protein
MKSISIWRTAGFAGRIWTELSPITRRSRRTGTAASVRTISSVACSRPSCIAASGSFAENYGRLTVESDRSTAQYGAHHQMIVFDFDVDEMPLLPRPQSSAAGMMSRILSPKSPRKQFMFRE